MISLSKIKQLIEKEDEGPTLDYKEDLNLQNDGDKAQFVKDVLSLANSGQTAHIILGVEDGTRKLKGIESTQKAEQLNDILKGKCDPPLTVEYAEKSIMGNKVGVIEFSGEDPPYIVAVPDRFGGPLLHDPQKRFFIERGMIFVRNFNKNEGACRADLERMYKVKYVTLQAELELSHEVSVKSLDDSKEVDIDFKLINTGDVLATSAYLRLRFHNIEGIVDKGTWEDISKYNDNIPTTRLVSTVPICPEIPLIGNKIKVKVKNDTEQIEAYMWLGAANMRIKKGTYVIPL